MEKRARRRRALRDVASSDTFVNRLRHALDEKRVVRVATLRHAFGRGPRRPRLFVIALVDFL